MSCFLCGKDCGCRLNFDQRLEREMREAKELLAEPESRSSLFEEFAKNIKVIVTDKMKGSGFMLVGADTKIALHHSYGGMTRMPKRIFEKLNVD